MSDARTHLPPVVIQAIEEATQAINYTMGSDLLTGSLLRTLVATKPAGTILELGTGTGLGTAWLLDGMDAAMDAATWPGPRASATFCHSPPLNRVPLLNQRPSIVRQMRATLYHAVAV